MLCEKSLGEIHEVRNNLVIAISPVACKLKAIGGFLASAPAAFVIFLNM
jgi:hypothetical protein